MDTHLETMQTGLDGLRDFLQGYNCNIDPDVLLGVNMQCQISKL